jgi:PAS domain S-box-containing protein
MALVADRDGVIREWDSRCAEVFGYRAEEAIGQTLDLIVPPPLQKLHWRGFQKAVSTGDLKRPGKTLRVPAVHQSGALISLQLDDTGLGLDAAGNVVRVSVTPSRGPRWVTFVSRPVLAALRLAHRD